jgi:hypothetical protein
MRIVFFCIGAIAVASGIVLAIFTAVGRLTPLTGYSAGLAIALGGGVSVLAGRHLFEHGRLSYLQIPATNVRASGEFYASVFGWEVGGGDDDHLSFSDATRGMIGAWITGRVPSQECCFGSVML